MKIDHIGIAVKDLNKAIKYWTEIFDYKQMTEIVKNTRQKVWVVFMHKRDSMPVKLISPVDKTSSIYRFAKRGGGVHHLCFNCGDLEKKLEHLRELGLRILTKPEPGEAFQGENIAFLHAHHLGNMELIDTEKRCFFETHKKSQDKNA